MASRPEVSGKKIAVTGSKVTDRRKVDPGDDDDDAAECITIWEFCRKNRISEQLFHKRRDEMPETFNVGARVLISPESRKRWRLEREEISRQARQVTA